MKDILIPYLKIALAAVLSLGLFACEYEQIADADYPAARIYMPSAVNGVYTIASPPPPTGASRFHLNTEETRFIVPLSVYRSGPTTSGTVDVLLASRPDTVETLLQTGALAGVESLPADVYTIPESIAISDGEDLAKFELDVDLDFLLGNTDKKFALAVGITGADLPVSNSLGTTVIVIDATLFIPVANFTFAKSSTDPLLYTFTNSSVNGASYVWSFNDGSDSSVERAPTHRFPNTGTFSVTLTTYGVAGAFSSVKTIDVVVQ